MKPKLIFNANIDFDKKNVEIKYWNVENQKPEQIPIGILNKNEIKEIFKNEISKGFDIKEIVKNFPHISDDKIKNLKMRKKILKTYKEKYKRR